MTDRPRSRRLTLALGLALATAACTPGADGSATSPSTQARTPVPDVRIAFVEDLSPDGAAQRIAPAFQGARLAVDTAGLTHALGATVHVVPLDTGGTTDGVADVAREITGDPSYVAVVIAPQFAEQVPLGDRFDAVGIPVISLSTLEPDLAERGWSSWRRAVANIDAEARALVAALAERGGVRRACLLGDGTPASVALTHAVRGILPVRPTLRLGLADTEPDDPTVVAAIRGAACRSVVWGGSPFGGALLRLALVEAGLGDVGIFGGESLKDDIYITTAGAAGHGTIAVCPCADVSTSTALRARRFIQDYQSTFGTPPGSFAAEGWDVTRMVLDAIESGSPTRAGVSAALASVETYDGLAGRYVFARNGTLEGASASVRLYRDDDARWAPVRSSPAG